MNIITNVNIKRQKRIKAVLKVYKYKSAEIGRNEVEGNHYVTKARMRYGI